MGDFKPMGPDGLIESVGQGLEPCNPQGQNPAMIAPSNGQWTLRFNYENPTKLRMLVGINFVAPFPGSAELCSEMDESQVENLRDWLSRILDAMNGRTPVP